MGKCVICNNEKAENITILGKSICADCEWKILTESVHSTGYNKCAAQLKKVFNKV